MSLIASQEKTMAMPAWLLVWVTRPHRSAASMLCSTALSRAPAHASGCPGVGDWRLINALAVWGVMIPAQLYASIALAKPVQLALDATVVEASWFGNLSSLAYAVGFPALIPLYNIHERRLALVAVVALVVSTLLLALAPGIEVAIAARALQGFTAAMSVPAALACVAEAVPYAKPWGSR